MDRVETANQTRAKQWTKEAKVGEGTYAVVYRGERILLWLPNALVNTVYLQVERPRRAAVSLSRKSKLASSRMG